MSPQNPIVTRKKKFVSHSKLQIFQECNAKFRHQYIRKVYLRKKPVYFTFGSAGHRFFDIYYASKGEKLDYARSEALKIFDDVDRGPLTPEEIYKLELERAKVEGVVLAYPKFYNKDFSNFETILTEISLKKDKGILLTSTRDYDVYYEGDIDGLVKDRDGSWWIMEHKFLAPQTINESLLDRVHIDNQILGYMWLAKERVIGEWPKGVIYNLIKKPMIRRKKGETAQAFTTRVKDEYVKYGQTKGYFIRHDPQISKAHLDTWWKDTAHLANGLFTRIEIKSDLWPKNTGSCTNAYGSCPYLNACVNRKYNKLIYTRKRKE